jgi:electron transport complex protein RnfD
MSGPYLHKNKSVQRSMLLVMVALVPATAHGFWYYGWPAIILFAVTLGSAMLFEVLCLSMARRPIVIFATDCSALVTAWLLAVSLPPWAPWWIAVVGSASAVILGKHVFGGLGQNLFNPAMVARVVLLISFPLEMTNFVQLTPINSANAPGFSESLAIIFGSVGFDGYTSATLLDSVTTGAEKGQDVKGLLERAGFSARDWLLGVHAGSLGEGSDILLFLGGLMLVYTRVIRWHIPVSFLLGLAALSTLCHLVDSTAYPPASVHLFGGTTMLLAFFIATDPVTSPMAPRGQVLFGVALAALVFIIRTWAAYPEGASFAVLLMNAVTPLIDRYVKPRIFGRTLAGEPLNLAGRK